MSHPIPPCRHDIWTTGELVFTTHSIGTSAEVELWVKTVATRSEQPVDWHYSGGLVKILALGDISRVRKALRELMGDHDTRFRRELSRYNLTDRDPPRPDWWEGEAPTGT